VTATSLLAADFQKGWFKRQPGNRDEFIRTGLYRWSQYPNYSAEIAIWWAIFFWAGFPHVFASNPWIIVSPLIATVNMRWGAGVMMLEQTHRERYGHRADYQEYTATTPVLLPFMKPFYAKQAPPAAEQGLLTEEGSL
jgi:steroid 5-alpha reductase family enzyme